MTQIRLVYYRSDEIQRFCSENPIDWKTRKEAEMGNIMPPSPAIGIFFSTLMDYGHLFTQQEYYREAWNAWKPWTRELSEEEAAGMKARLYRNFYPSAIDSLHAWSLLVESGEFAYCILDTAEDATDKKDITVWTNDDISIGIELFAANNYTGKWRKHKARYRGTPDGKTVEVPLTFDRPRRPGNKRWYTMADFKVVLETIQEMRERKQSTELYKEYAQEKIPF